MKGLNILSVQTVGCATYKEVLSGFCSAIDFGASSPMTTCKKVMIAKESPAERLWATSSSIWVGNSRISGSNITPRAGSAIQPNPKLAKVIPS
jgi:hypothetical protein